MPPVKRTRRAAAQENKENISANVDVTPLKRTNAKRNKRKLAGILEELDLEIQTRCESLANHGESLCLNFKAAYELEMMKIPKKIRQMSLIEFYDKYGSTIKSSMMTDIGKAVEEAKVLNPSCIPKAASASKPPTARRAAATRTTRSTRASARLAAKSTHEPATPTPAPIDPIEETPEPEAAPAASTAAPSPAPSSPAHSVAEPAAASEADHMTDDVEESKAAKGRGGRVAKGSKRGKAASKTANEEPEPEVIVVDDDSEDGDEPAEPAPAKKARATRSTRATRAKKPPKAKPAAAESEATETTETDANAAESKPATRTRSTRSSARLAGKVSLTPDPTDEPASRVTRATRSRKRAASNISNASEMSLPPTTRSTRTSTASMASVTSVTEETTSTRRSLRSATKRRRGDDLNASMDSSMMDAQDSEMDKETSGVIDMTEIPTGFPSLPTEASRIDPRLPETPRDPRRGEFVVSANGSPLGVWGSSIGGTPMTPMTHMDAMERMALNSVQRPGNARRPTITAVSTADDGSGSQADGGHAVALSLPDGSQINLLDRNSIASVPPNLKDDALSALRSLQSLVSNLVSGYE
eukprot:Rmarinus@m.20048